MPPFSASLINQIKQALLDESFYKRVDNRVDKRVAETVGPMQIQNNNQQIEISDPQAEHNRRNQGKSSFSIW